jgi:hypothetical protein
MDGIEVVSYVLLVLRVDSRVGIGWNEVGWSQVG